MATKIIFSNSFDAKVKRIKRIPELIDELVLTYAKRDAMRMMQNFHDGIKQNSFRLQRLEDGTIVRKRAIAAERPNVPLYERGDSARDRSFVNMLRLRKVKGGYKVFPSRAKHHKSDLKLSALLDVHENGRTIVQSRSGGSTTLIRIPPRPAFQKAFNRTLRQKRNAEDAKEVRRVYSAFIRLGKLGDAQAAKRKAVARLRRFERRTE